MTRDSLAKFGGVFGAKPSKATHYNMCRLDPLPYSTVNGKIQASAFSDFIFGLGAKPHCSIHAEEPEFLSAPSKSTLLPVQMTQERCWYTLKKFTATVRT